MADQREVGTLMLILGSLVWVAALTGALMWYSFNIVPWFLIWFTYGWAVFFGVVGMLIICAVSIPLLILMFENLD